jgi:hypothetical protein
MKKMGSYTIPVLLAFSFAWLSGCGAAGQAPQGGSININPAGFTWNVAPGGCGSASPAAISWYTPVSITVIGSNGLPLNDTDITISLDHSSGMGPLPPTMELYDDQQGNNNNDPDAGEFVLAPFRTKTKDFGTKTVLVTMDLGGCEYKGTLNVQSGTIFSSVDFEVKNTS